MYIFRVILAGFFMGLANLVPGVSGGTMVLALGFYDRFITVFSRVSKLKLTKNDILFLGILFGLSFLTILSLAGVIQISMEKYRSEMLGLFIGFTLGGVPTIYGELRDVIRKPSVLLSILGGFIIMAMVAFVFKPASLPLNFLVYFGGGLIGSSAMILPGISGSYLLLILGLYLPIIGAIHQFKNAIISMQIDNIIRIGTSVVLPFGLGMVIGILALSNILNFFLQKYEFKTKGVLLGLLLGSVLGLYPFAPQPLEKLLKYSINDGQQRVLHVNLYGTHIKNSSIFKQLSQLHEFGPKIDIIVNSDFNSEAILFAKTSKAVVVLYDLKLADKLRTMLRQHNVHYMVIANTDASWQRGLVICLLILVGAFTTYMIGKIKKEESL